MSVWRGAQLTGIIPLYECLPPRAVVGLKTLRFLSTGEAEYEETCPDYLDLLCRPHEEAACARAVWQTVQEGNWDQLELLDLPQDSPLVRGEEPPHGAGRLRLVPRGECCIADLSGGFDRYLGRLSANTRRQARVLLREAERAGTTLELATASDIDAFFDDLVALHQARWTAAGKPGCFAAARFRAFHRSLAHAWVPTGHAIIARLAHERRPTAALYGFVTGGKFDFYQSGVALDAGTASHSAGTLAHLLLMRRLAERGVTRYDFLRGSARYKERLATDAVPLIALRMWRPTVRAALHRSSRLIGRALRGGARRAWRRTVGMRSNARHDLE